jgi:ABC-2 type transport system ATP-binding protein
MSKDEIAIIVKDVYKDFKLPHKRKNSLKSIFTGMFESKNRAKTYESQHALRDVSFEIKKGEFFGIVGRNGSGKSTLLKMLAGIYQPTKGSVAVAGKLVPFIELGVGFNPELTGRENVYLNGALLGFSETEIDGMYNEIVSFAELENFMDQKLKNYSSGMQVRLAFSMAVRADAEILLIDEVLAVGDADFQRKCFDYFKLLKRNKKTVVFVSHDMSAVREYCDRAILVEKSEIIETGDASRIADLYTKMFIDQATASTSGSSESRWGDGTIKFTEVSVSKPILNDNDTELIIETTATAIEDVSNPIFGFSITAPNGSQVFGTNTHIRKKKIGHFKKGSSLSVRWEVPNIFNEGTHFLNTAVIYDNGTSVSDWWDEASVFNVVKQEKTPYIVAPNIPVSIKANGHKLE